MKLWGMGYGVEACCMCMDSRGTPLRGLWKAVVKPLGGRDGKEGSGGGGGHGGNALGHDSWVRGFLQCIGISRHASRGPLECGFESTWMPFPSLWEASWGFLGAYLEPLGGLWGPFGALLGPPGAPGNGKLDFLNFWPPSWAPGGAVLERSQAVLGTSWSVWEPSWAVLGPSWGPLGLSWGFLWCLLGRLGASGRRKNENANKVENTMENQQFQPFGALLEGLFGTSSAVLEASRPVLGPS